MINDNAIIIKNSQIIIEDAANKITDNPEMQKLGIHTIDFASFRIIIEAKRLRYISKDKNRLKT